MISAASTRPRKRQVVTALLKTDVSYVESQGAKVLLVLELNPIHQAVTYPTSDTVSDSYAPCFSFTIPHVSLLSIIY